MKYFIVTIILALSGCTGQEHYYVKSEVSAVYWHEGTKFSVVIREGNVVHYRRLAHNVPVRVLTDVAPREPIWYECRWAIQYVIGLSSNPTQDSLCTIHIRSVDDVLGAGWNHGKFGRGITTRIDK